MIHLLFNFAFKMVINLVSTSELFFTEFTCIYIELHEKERVTDFFSLKGFTSVLFALVSKKKLLHAMNFS